VVGGSNVYVTKNHAVDSWREEEVEFHIFLNFVLGADKWSASGCDRFTVGKLAPAFISTTEPVHVTY
jgi:hypothetical protein